MESYMVAVERIDEYSKMEVEGASSADERKPPDSWPNMGCLTFDDVWMRYRYASHGLGSCSFFVGIRVVVCHATVYIRMHMSV
jgi:hypothetical protein